MTFRQASPSALWFAAPLLMIYTAAFVIVGVLPTVQDPAAIAVGLTFDLVILVPALYYFILVRGRGWPSFTLAPVFLLSFGAASFLVPAEHPALLGVIGYALPLIEFAVVGYVGVRGWRLIRAGRAARLAGSDFYDWVRETLNRALDRPALVGALAYEVSLFHYAFTLRRAEAPPHGFAYHRRSGYGAILFALLMAAVFELVAVHFLLQMWSATAALVHAAISLYGIAWLVGDYRAMRRRPHELHSSELRIRHGLRWDLSVPWSRVALIHKTRRPAEGADYLSTVPLGQPQYVVVLHSPADATGPYGVTRSVQRIGILVDDAEAFEERLRELEVELEVG